MREVRRGGMISGLYLVVPLGKPGLVWDAKGAWGKQKMGREGWWRAGRGRRLGPGKEDGGCGRREIRDAENEGWRAALRGG